MKVFSESGDKKLVFKTGRPLNGLKDLLEDIIYKSSHNSGLADYIVSRVESGYIKELRVTPKSEFIAKLEDGAIFDSSNIVHDPRLIEVPRSHRELFMDLMNRWVVTDLDGNKVRWISKSESKRSPEYKPGDLLFNRVLIGNTVEDSNAIENLIKINRGVFELKKSVKSAATGGTPRPDLKTFKSETEKEVDIPQDQKRNRTQPKNDPTPAIITPSSKGFSLKSFKAPSQASSKPALANVATIRLNSDDWLFTQATAVCSLPVEEDGFTIKPCGNDLVNANGNAFSNELMAKMYPTFVGSHNYIDHDQDPSRSYGVLLDAVPRKIILDEKKGEYSLYVDTLIATSRRKDPEWARMIETGEVKYLSMGCESSALQCSKCGHLACDADQDCEHMEYELGMNYIDENGVKRRVAALVSDHPNDNGESFSYFIELSYLSVDPAFTGAIQGHVIEVPENTDIEVSIPRKTLEREAFQVWKDYIKGM